MLQVMATMARKCSRARYYSPEELREEYVRAVFESCDFGNTEEVTTLYYIAKGLVKGRRAADELFLEWGDVDRVEATASTSAGQVTQRPHVHMHMCHQAGTNVTTSARCIATPGKRTTRRGATSRRACRV